MESNPTGCLRSCKLREGLIAQRAFGELTGVETIHLLQYKML